MSIFNYIPVMDTQTYGKTRFIDGIKQLDSTRAEQNRLTSKSLAQIDKPLTNEKILKFQMQYDFGLTKSISRLASENHSMIKASGINIGNLAGIMCNQQGPQYMNSKVEDIHFKNLMGMMFPKAIDEPANPVCFYDLPIAFISGGSVLHTAIPSFLKPFLPDINQAIQLYVELLSANKDDSDTIVLMSVQGVEVLPGQNGSLPLIHFDNIKTPASILTAEVNTKHHPTILLTREFMKEDNGDFVKYVGIPDDVKSTQGTLIYTVDSADAVINSKIREAAMSINTAHQFVPLEFIAACLTFGAKVDVYQAKNGVYSIFNGPHENKQNETDETTYRLQMRFMTSSQTTKSKSGEVLYGYAKQKYNPVLDYDMRNSGFPGLNGWEISGCSRNEQLHPLSGLPFLFKHPQYWVQELGITEALRTGKINTNFPGIISTIFGLGPDFKKADVLSGLRISSRPPAIEDN